jgi:hypothetical protein
MATRYWNWARFAHQALEIQATASLKYLPPGTFCTVDYPVKLKSNTRACSRLIAESAPNPLYIFGSIVRDAFGQATGTTANFIVPCRDPGPNIDRFRAEWENVLSVFIVRPLNSPGDYISPNISCGEGVSADSAQVQRSALDGKQLSNVDDLFDIEYYLPTQLDWNLEDQSQYDLGLFAVRHTASAQKEMRGKADAHVPIAPLGDDETEAQGLPGRESSKHDAYVEAEDNTLPPSFTASPDYPDTSVTTWGNQSTASHVEEPDPPAEDCQQALRCRCTCLPCGRAGSVEETDLALLLRSEPFDWADEVDADLGRLALAPYGADETNLEKSPKLEPLNRLEEVEVEGEENRLLPPRSSHRGPSDNRRDQDSRDTSGPFIVSSTPPTAAKSPAPEVGRSTESAMDLPSISEDSNVEDNEYDMDSLQEMADGEISRQAHILEHHPHLHHINWMGEAAMEPCHTSPEESLFVILTGPKACLWESSREGVVLRQALRHIDPVIYDGDLEVLANNNGHTLLEAITGNTFPFYPAVGSWQYDDSIQEADRDERLYDPMDPSMYVNNQAIPFNGWFQTNISPSRWQFWNASEARSPGGRRTRRGRQPFRRSPLQQYTIAESDEVNDDQERVLVVQGKTQYLSYDLPESATSSGMTTPVSSDEEAEDAAELEHATPPVVSGLAGYSADSIKPQDGVLRIGDWDVVSEGDEGHRDGPQMLGLVVGKGKRKPSPSRTCRYPT